MIEGDESDRTVFGLAGGDRRDHERRARPSQRVRLARPSSRPSSTAGPRARRTSSATRRPTRARSRLPGAHNRAQRGRGAGGARSLRASPGPAAEAALARLHRHRAAVRGVRGRRGDDRRRLRPPPDRARRDDRGGPRGLPGPAAARALPAAPRLAHAPPRGRARRRARRQPTTSSSPRSTSPASSPIPASAGKLVVEALSDRGRLAAWIPAARRRPPPTWRGRAEPGDVRARRSAPATSTGAPALLRARRLGGAGDDRARAVRAALARFTTIGTGGPARCFAPPGDARRSSASCSPGRPGSGVDGRDDRARLESPRPRRRASTRSCCGSAGELAAVGIEGETLVAGGGATNAVCLHRARAAGLGGFEFASAIPGTAGGGLRMNAGAYGSDWRSTMIDALVVDARRARGP